MSSVLKLKRFATHKYSPSQCPLDIKLRVLYLLTATNRHCILALALTPATQKQQQKQQQQQTNKYSSTPPKKPVSQTDGWQESLGNEDIGLAG